MVNPQPVYTRAGKLVIIISRKPCVVCGHGFVTGITAMWYKINNHTVSFPGFYRAFAYGPAQAPSAISALDIIVVPVDFTGQFIRYNRS